MSNRRVGLWGAWAGAVAMAWVLAAPTGVAGQQATKAGKAPAPAAKAATAPASVTPKTPPAATKKAWTVSRMPDGHPDLQGYWTNITYTDLERPKDLGDKEFFTEREAEEYWNRESVATAANEKVVHYTFKEFGLTPEQDGGKVNLRTSLIVDPPDGRLPPLTAAARERAAARRAAVKPLPETAADLGIGMSCIYSANVGPMLPNNYSTTYLILQTPGYVTILYEQNTERRIIPIDGRPHLPGSIRQWLGDSRGHWEGDTLIVESTNFSPKRNFQGSDGTFHVVERFTRTAADVIDYRFTVEDPTTWTKPWTAAVPLNKSEGPMLEFACNEGNFDAVGHLMNARAQEKGLVQPYKPERRSNPVEEFKKKAPTTIGVEKEEK